MDYQVVAVVTESNEGMEIYDGSIKITPSDEFTADALPIGIAMKTSSKWFAERIAERLGGYVEENKDLMELTYFAADRHRETIGVTYCENVVDIMKEILGRESISGEIDQVAFSEYLDKIEQLERENKPVSKTDLFFQKMEEMDQV